MIRFARTSCPEQFDAFDEQGQPVGYVRVRRGSLRVHYPDASGDLVLFGCPGNAVVLNNMSPDFVLEGLIECDC